MIGGTKIVHRHTHRQTQTDTDTQTHRHTDTDTDTHTHRHTHTHTDTHTHTHGDKMAEEKETVIHRALENIVNATVESGNLRKDLKTLILQSVSNIRIELAELNAKLESSTEQNKILNSRITSMSGKVEAPEDARRRFARQVVPSTDLSRNHHTAPPRNCERELYADVAGSTAHTATKRHKLTVSSKLNESPEAIRTILKNKINPTALKIGVKAMKTLKDGRLLVESGSKEEIEALNKKINEECSQVLESKVTPLRNPNLIIYNIPSEIGKDNAEQVIRTQNSELSLKEGEIKPKFIFTDKRKHTNLVVEVTSETRKKILQQKLKLGWLICNTEDYNSPIRCFKCSRYNHRTIKCKGEEICPLCTGSHKMRECTAPRADHKCINCANYNKHTKNAKIPENHTSLDKECPSLLAVTRKNMENTDY